MKSTLLSIFSFFVCDNLLPQRNVQSLCANPVFLCVNLIDALEADFEMLDESAFYAGSDGSVALYTREGQSNIVGRNESEFELVLPSGARLGHRSLHRYYRQSFGHRSLERKALANVTLKDKCLAISMGQNYSGEFWRGGV